MYASNRPSLGRRMLMTDEREITKDNIIQVVAKAFMEHQENVAEEVDRKSTRLNSSHTDSSRMPSSA